MGHLPLGNPIKCMSVDHRVDQEHYYYHHIVESTPYKAANLPHKSWIM